MIVKSMRIAFLCLLAGTLAGCMQPILWEEPAETEESTRTGEAAQEHPRVLASLQLTDQGRRFLEDHKPDKAIRVLEQAISLNPTDGKNYYYLSEAWLMKGSATQAKEFNQLAEIHLSQDSEWMIRVAQQADRIAELEK